MASKLSIASFLLMLLLLVFAEAQSSGNSKLAGAPPGSNGNRNGQQPFGSPPGNRNGAGSPYANGALDPASTHYLELYPIAKTGQERAICLARGKCFLSVLRCPPECPQRKPKKNKKVKGCFIDCSSRCESTCKKRKPNCNGYGSICYDPRFVGGDGVMFYFHGAKHRNFALVSDDHLQINAHFIGIRPQHRQRDFTWVQSLALMFDSHTLVVGTKPVSFWDDRIDALTLLWDGTELRLPNNVEAEWRSTPAATATDTTITLDNINDDEGGSNDDEKNVRSPATVVVERLEERNSVRVRVEGVMEMDVRAVPVTKEDDRIHGYNLPADDAFAHLEMQFKFGKLTEEVEGVLGRTYRPGYVSPVKKGVAMPIMGGEDKYLTSSLSAADCKACRFVRGPPQAAADQ